jgi:DNA-binding CsgD family transcriptional regulator
MSEPLREATMDDRFSGRVIVAIVFRVAKCLLVQAFGLGAVLDASDCVVE